MATDHILTLLIAERVKLDKAIAALKDGGSVSSGTPKKPAAIETHAAPKKRKVSAAARKRMAEGQKKRWAALKATK
jgi:hypothetical protein